MNKTIKKSIITLSLLSTFAISGCFDKGKTENSTNIETKNQTTSVTQSIETQVDQKELKKNKSLFKEGVHYRSVNNIDSKGLEEPFIVEYFWLACGHCQNIEPLIKLYLSENEDFSLLRKHGAFNDVWMKDAKIFNRLMIMGLEEHFDDLFKVYIDATQNRRVVTNEDISLFLESKSIDPQSFWMGLETEEAMSSLEESLSEMTYNKIAGVPALVVNGKYLLTPTMDNGITTQSKYFELLDYLKNKK